MKTIEVTTYSFEELSPEAQEKVLERFAQFALKDTSFQFDSLREDAKDIGFDLQSVNDNPISGEGSFIHHANFTAGSIMENHGESCETYKLAKTFKEQYDKLVDQLDNSDCQDTTDSIEESIDELVNEFESDLGHAYGVMWSKELEYQTSEEAIKETIEANEYSFLANGEIARF